jgi:hypothetical protein
MQGLSMLCPYIATNISNRPLDFAFNLPALFIPTATCNLPSSGFWLLASGFWLPASGLCLPPASYQLPAAIYCL